MKLHATRLKEGQDLKRAISHFAGEKKMNAGVVVSAVGSLSHAVLRMPVTDPAHQDFHKYNEPLEIVSLIGTIASDGGLHLHLSVSDRE